MEHPVGPTITHVRSCGHKPRREELEPLPEALADSTLHYQYNRLRLALCRGNRSQTTKTRRYASFLGSKPKGFYADHVREKFQVKKPMA